MLVLLLLFLLLFRLGSYLLLPSEPVGLVPGLRYSAGPLGAVLRLGVPEKIESHLSDWNAVFYDFRTELEGTPADVELRFADGLWLTELSVRAETEDPARAEALFEAWCVRLDEAYRDAEGYQNHGVTQTEGGKELCLEIRKGALGLSCRVSLEGCTVAFYGCDQWERLWIPPAAPHRRFAPALPDAGRAKWVLHGPGINPTAGGDLLPPAAGFADSIQLSSVKIKASPARRRKRSYTARMVCMSSTGM